MPLVFLGGAGACAWMFAQNILWVRLLGVVLAIGLLGGYMKDRRERGL